MKALVFAVLLVAASVGVARAQDAAGGQPAARVSVLRDGDRWTVDYQLALDSPAYAFRASALMREGRRAWRTERWTVETPGVQLVRIGRYDVLRSADGGPLPSRVRIAMRPAGGDLEAAYTPSLVFTDGSVALYTEQFNLIPLDSAEAAADLPADLNGVELPGGPTEVSWRDASGPVLFRGQRRDGVTAIQADSYVYFGAADAAEAEAIAAIVDPALPAWLAGSLDDFTPRVMAHYAERLGPRVGDRPTLMVSWSGPTAGVTSMAGSVLPNLVVMDLEGEGVVERYPAVFNACGGSSPTRPPTSGWAVRTCGMSSPATAGSRKGAPTSWPSAPSPRSIRTTTPEVLFRPCLTSAFPSPATARWSRPATGASIAPSMAVGRSSPWRSRLPRARPATATGWTSSPASAGPRPTTSCPARTGWRP